MKGNKIKFLKNRKGYLIIILLMFTISTVCFSQILYKNKHVSVSKGDVHNGSLKNGWLMPYKGSNFSYFSIFSYYLLGRAYVHHQVYNTLMNSYKQCEKKVPSIHFKYMECSKKKGGRMKPHRTHQNGLSVDFMVPLKKNDRQVRIYDHSGIFHYLMNFDAAGNFKLHKKVKIDFETMAQHILILDAEARKNGMYIKKVILKLNLKNDLFETTSGQLLKKKNIYFAQHLPKKIDNLHDDHYHVDFGFLNSK